MEKIDFEGKKLVILAISPHFPILIYNREMWGNRSSSHSKSIFSTKKQYFLSGFFFTASYGCLLARKHNNLVPQCKFRRTPRFESQNVEYVGFIDRAPHVW